MRIIFTKESRRKSFFKEIKENYNTNWKEIRLMIGVSKATLERYVSGQTSIPEEIFLKFLRTLNGDSQENVLGEIKRLPNNHGQIKGGKIAYKLNYKKFEEGRKKAIKVNKTKKEKRFNFDSIELSEDVYEFIGAFIGDGFFNSYNNKLYQVEFAGDSNLDLNYYKEKIIPAIVKVFPNLNPRIYKVRSKNAIRVVFYSKELFCFLRDYIGFVPGKKAHTVEIPEKILVNPNFIYLIVRGLFDTDGGIYFDKRKGYKKIYPRIHFSTVSKRLFIQLSKILSEEFKVYTRYNKKRNIYIIELYGYPNLKKWMSLIGFSNERHFKKVASVA